MQAIIDQLTNSNYRRNSDKHQEDWQDIDLSSLDEGLIVRLNIKHPDSNEPERLLVVIDGYISTYYDVNTGSVYGNPVDSTPPPVIEGNLTKKQLRAKVEQAQIDFGVDSNFFSLLTSVKTLALATQTSMGPNATAAHEWVRNIWTTKYYAQTLAHEGPYSFSEDGIEELDIGFGDVENESLT